jgi:hypothetical protein
MFAGNPEPIVALHRRLSRLYERSLYGDSDGLAALVERLVDASVEAADRQPNPAIRQALVDLVQGLLTDNDLAFTLPDLDPTLANNDAYALPLRRRLGELEPLLVHEQRIRDNFNKVAAALVLGILERHLPGATFQGRADSDPMPPASFKVPLHALLPDPADFVQDALTLLLGESRHNREEPIRRTFAATRAQLLDNLSAASGLRDLADLHKNLHKIVLPRDSDREAAELVAAYLEHTPFAGFLQTQVPYAIPDHLRPEHALVVAASGIGKTQLIQHDILSLIARDDPPAMVVIDSQGHMLRKIERLACFDPERGRLKERLIVIDPEDESSPALNMFVIPTRVERYDRNIRETIEAGTLQLFNFIFAALSQELTGRQSTAFSFVTRLMHAVPGATLRTLRQLLEDNAKSLERSPFAPYIAKLDEDAQAFFRNQFFETGYAATRNQIVQRLYGVLRVPAFNRMFGSPENRLDLFQALQDGKIVLFNTSKALLGDDASSLFGRYAIALAIRAAFERVAASEPYRLTLLYIDEAKEYFKDATLDNLLTQVRKYNMGALIAFQNLDQLPATLRPIVLANTSIKLCAGVTDHDARLLARDMRTTSEMLLSLTKHDRSSEFAGYLRNETPRAIQLTVPFGTLEAAPQMSACAYAHMRAANRRRIAVTETPTTNAMQAPGEPVDPSQPAPDW